MPEKRHGNVEILITSKFSHIEKLPQFQSTGDIMFDFLGGSLFVCELFQRFQKSKHCDIAGGICSEYLLAAGTGNHIFGFVACWWLGHLLTATGKGEDVVISRKNQFFSSIFYFAGMLMRNISMVDSPHYGMISLKNIF